MSITTVVFLAFALAMDAFAVSVVNSMCFLKQSKTSIVLSSFLFGFFQAIMPLIGFWAGTVFIGFISSFDHWIAFILLFAIGGKMIYSCIKEWATPFECPPERHSPQKRLIFIQAIATSIDAMAVGISLAALGTNIVSAAINIGIITFITCLFGHILGKHLGVIFSKWAQILGGAILILIGSGILLEHLMQ